MDEPALPDLPPPDFDDLVGELAKLSRNHLLFFRIEVGRRLSKAFYDHDPGRYRASQGVKGSSFRRFAADRAAELADIGLSDGLLRESLRAFFVVKDLPRELVTRLVYSHVVELTRVEDAETRSILARAAVENAWSGAALANAVLQVRAGRWPDGDPEQPGLQPVPPPEPEPGASRSPQTGRVVTRFERTPDDLDNLVGQWEQVPVDRLTSLQRTRVREALAPAKHRLTALEERLGAS